jgi:hypothetical protein
MFDEKSRYRKAETYKVKDRRGRQVSVVTVPGPLVQTVMGIHLLKEGQRLDHLAAKYLSDPAGFWRICEANGSMLAEALSEQPEITIPNRSK